MGVLTERRQKLVDALRDGSFTQSYYALQDKSGYCCLGVASELTRLEHPGDIVKYDSGDGTMTYACTEAMISAISTNVGDPWHSSSLQLIAPVIDFYGFRYNDAIFSKPITVVLSDQTTIVSEGLTDLNDLSELPFPDIADVIVAHQDLLFISDPDGGRLV
jgi:hypothetical protein